MDATSLLFSARVVTCMYRVIGECYINSIMDGELIESKERENYKEVDLTFC